MTMYSEVMNDPVAVDSSGERKRDKKPRPVHVLFIIDELCETGGAERCLLNIAAGLPKARFRSSIATFRIDRSLELFSNISCPVHVLPLTKTYGWHSARVAWKLRKLIREEGVSIVHTFFETSDIWGGIVAKLSGCRALVSSRRDMGILRSPKHKLAYRLIEPLFDRVVAVSDEVRSFCIGEDRSRGEKVITVYNGIDLSKIDATGSCTDIRHRLNVKPSALLVISVGHIREVKGMHTLVEAAGRVCRECPEAVFVVVGDSSDKRYYAELLQSVVSMNLEDKVRFLGPSEDVISFLKASDVFCLLSRSEGFSNAILEAMSCCLPVVTTRVGGNPEAVEDKLNGFLLELGDSQAAARRIIELLRNERERQRMGRAGRAIIERKFTDITMIQKLTDVYEGLLGQSPKTGC
jgi:glycosyltransferase involved in cell wall biosynthesis